MGFTTRTTRFAASGSVTNGEPGLSEHEPVAFCERHDQHDL